MIGKAPIVVLTLYTCACMGMEMAPTTGLFPNPVYFRRPQVFRGSPSKEIAQNLAPSRARPGNTDCWPVGHFAWTLVYVAVSRWHGMVSSGILYGPGELFLKSTWSRGLTNLALERLLRSADGVHAQLAHAAGEVLLLSARAARSHLRIQGMGCSSS